MFLYKSNNFLVSISDAILLSGSVYDSLPCSSRKLHSRERVGAISSPA